MHLQAEWYRGVLLKDLQALDGSGGASNANSRINNVVMHLKKVLYYQCLLLFLLWL